MAAAGFRISPSLMGDDAPAEIRQPQVFLSYSRADRARVTKLADALKAAGIGVWWDTAIEGGASFSADIERELEAADVVLVVWSATSVKSTWVLDEAGHGRDRGRLVPVQLDATLPPLGFRQFQAIDLSAWKGRAGDARFAALLLAIRKLADAAPAAQVVAPVAPKPVGPSRRALIGGAAGVAALAAGGFGGWKLWGGKADDGTASVVVLPFANLSGDPAQAFFSDGIAEELRNALSQISGLRVVGRVTSERYRDAEDLSAVAEELGVENILTGSVRRSATTIRIGAQLVDGKSGMESWSQSFDQPIGDSLVIQSRIANSVVAALSPKLAEAAGRIVVGGTSNARAQELLLKGRRQFQADPSEANIRMYSELLDTAIELDPNYADAWAAKAFQLDNLRGYTSSAQERARLLRDAMVASQRGVSLAPNSGFARTSLASRYLRMLEVRRAISEARKGVALAPSDPTVISNAASVIRTIDPEAAVALARQSVELDPFNAAYSNYLSSALISARRFEEAAEMAQQAMKLSDNRRGDVDYWYALFALGKLGKVRDLLPADARGLSGVGRTTIAAILEARAGDRLASDTALASLRAIDAVSIHYWLARVHAQRGEREAALSALETALAGRESALVNIATDYLLDPLRKEPVFKAVQDAVIPPDLFVPPKQA